MRILGATFDASAVRSAAPCRRGWLNGAGIVLATGALGVMLEASGDPLRDLGRAIASGSVHAAFVGAGWLVGAGGSAPLGGPISVATALGLASVAAWWSPWGAVLYLLPPLLLFVIGRGDPALRGIGLNARLGLRYLPCGLAAGAFLGIHLLVSASMTLGYAVRVGAVSHYLTAIAYDVGANALTAEWLFRGALFSRWWRRWQFWPAAGLSTALAVGRYLLDPALPLAIEVRAGAVLYMLMLGLSACALRAVSGSLLPGYLATIAFFAAYRTLAP